MRVRGEDEGGKWKVERVERLSGERKEAVDGGDRVGERWRGGGDGRCKKWVEGAPWWIHMVGGGCERVGLRGEWRGAESGGRRGWKGGESGGGEGGSFQTLVEARSKKSNFV